MPGRALTGNVGAASDNPWRRAPARRPRRTFPPELLAPRLETERPHRADAPGVEEAVDRRRVDVEGRQRRSDDRAGDCRAAHVLDVDERVGRLAESEQQGAPLLQADVRGALQQVARRAVGDRAERAGAARDDGHGRDGVGARGDRRADVGIGVDREARPEGTAGVEAVRPGLRRRDRGGNLVAGDHQGRVRDHEMEAREAPGRERDFDEAPGEQRSRASRNADHDLPVRHAAKFIRAGRQEIGHATGRVDTDAETDRSVTWASCRAADVAVAVTPASRVPLTRRA